MKNIQGLIAATYPPLDSNGKLNLKAIGPYAEFLARDKVDGVFLNGSTGDFASLTIEERKLIVEEWSHSKPKEFKLVVHVGDTSIENARELASHASKYHADAICSLAPYYFKPATIEDLVHYCEKIAASNPDSSFYYYHIPSLTGVNFDMVQFMEMAANTIPSFGGLKYSHEDLLQFKCCLDFENGKYDVLFGVDEILISVLVLGASSAVGSTYNHLTPLYHQLIDAFNRGEVQKASIIQKDIMVFVKTLSKYGFHAASKFILELLGLDLGPVRLPSANLSPLAKEALTKEITESGILEAIRESRD